MKKQSIRSNWDLGGLAAESDHLLATSYYDNGDYDTISSRREHKGFVIGRTGSGKSAAFSHLAEDFPGRVVTIVPENLSLPYLTNLDVIQHLVSLDVHLESFLVALWKHVMLVEVLKHRYHINSPETKQNVLTRLRDKLSRDDAKLRALSYLDEFGDKFWCEADERVRQIAEHFEERVRSAGALGTHGGVFSAGLGIGSETLYTVEERLELTRRYQRIVNETQLPRLNEMIVILNDEILDSEQHFTYLVIDDLDKEWVDGRLANTLIRCLFQAAKDMIPIRNLKILVALRTNIFRQLDYGSAHQGGQEEKIRGLVLPLQWTVNDLKAMLAQRAGAAGAFHNLETPLTLAQLLPNPNKSRGDPIEYILSRTLMRPRDAILFVNECLHEARGKPAVSWEDIRKAERRYSEERLAALRDEWKNPYPGIDRVFAGFKGQPARMEKRTLTQVLDEIALDLLCDPAFQGHDWFADMAEGLLASGEENQGSLEKMYGRVTSLLYEVSFLGIGAASRPDAERPAVYSYMPSTPPPDVRIFDAQVFVVHPAFRLALEMVDPIES